MSTKKTWGTYNEWIKAFGTEFNILLEANEADILKFNKEIGGAIIKVRNQEVKIKPGYDGVYGIPMFDGEHTIITSDNEKPEQKLNQKARCLF